MNIYLFSYEFICSSRRTFRSQITSTRGTGYVTFWYPDFLKTEKMLPQIVPGSTLETATLSSLGCLVLGSYESKKVF